MLSFTHESKENGRRDLNAHGFFEFMQATSEKTQAYIRMLVSQV